MTKTSQKPAVSILVVAYQSAALISACLNSIKLACTKARYEVLLIDNGDGSTESLVRGDFPDVRIIASRGNIGFAAANNALADHATAPLLLLANPDIEMSAGAVDALLEATARYPDAAAWGGVTLGRDGRPDIGNSVHVPSLGEMASRLLGRSNFRLDPDDSLDRDERVDALSGGFVMFSRSIWEAAGGLDERYFLYCEEVDLFHRLAQQGHHFWRIGNARAFHDIGHGHESSPLRELYLCAGNMQFTRLHWSRFRSVLAFLLIWSMSVQRVIAGGLLGFASPSLKRAARKHRLVATRPHFWLHGYDQKRGLLAKLNR